MSNINWSLPPLNFVCNAEKNKRNLKNHGLDLVQASMAFFDPFAFSVFDDAHSEEEDRFALLGKLGGERLVYIAYTMRGETIRLISARKATLVERKLYEQR